MQANLTPTQPWAPAKLVLHIEADTLSELMEQMDRVMNQMSGGHDLPELPDATPAARPAKVPKASKPKDAAPAQAPAQAPAPASLPDPLPEPTAWFGENSPPTTPPAAAPTNQMQTLTPDQARAQAISAAQRMFAQRPDCLNQITDLTKRYGIQNFVDVPDAQAHQFLADLMLIEAGAGVV